MQALLSPAQWSDDLIDHIKSLKEEKVFVDAIASTGIFTGIRSVDGMFLLQSNASLQETQAFVPAVAIEFDTSLLNLPYPLMRCALRPREGNPLERDDLKVQVKNLLVNGYAENRSSMRAEYVGLFEGKLVSVSVDVSQEDLPLKEGYREYRGLFFRSLVSNPFTQVDERLAPVQVPLKQWMAHADDWALTPTESQLWQTVALETVRAGGVPDEPTLREVFPSLRDNENLCTKVRELFQLTINQCIALSFKSPANLSRTAKNSLDAAVSKLKELEKSCGVSQPWHELTVLRLLREVMPDSLPLSVSRQATAISQLARIHETRFDVRVMGPLSQAYTLTLSNAYSPSGLEALTDNPRMSLR